MDEWINISIVNLAETKRVKTYKHHTTEISHYSLVLTDNV